MRAVLTWDEGGVPRRHEFEVRAVIGRDAGCEVSLSDGGVSRRHAVIEREGDGFVIRDLGSGNGTFVDGTGITSAALHSGEALRFGDFPAVFEVCRTPKTSSGKLRQTLSQTLSVAPTRRARKKEAVIVTAAGVALLFAVSAWATWCRPAAKAKRPVAVRPAP